VHISRGVTARAVAIERADRHVIGRRGDHGHVDGGPYRGAVTTEAVRYALVGAGEGVEREVARGRMALRARRSGRNMVRRLGVTCLVRGEGGRRGVAADALPPGGQGFFGGFA